MKLNSTSFSVKSRKSTSDSSPKWVTNSPCVEKKDVCV